MVNHNLFEITERPGRPGDKLNISDIYRDSVGLSWAPPRRDGGMPITGYIVEKRDSQVIL